ncbi:hypothetical protein L209DRAFT_603860 [Thermothelomyces heterothallicus CBS 203.75]
MYTATPAQVYIDVRSTTRVHRIRPGAPRHPGLCSLFPDSQAQLQSLLELVGRCAAFGGSAGLEHSEPSTTALTRTSESLPLLPCALETLPGMSESGGFLVDHFNDSPPPAWVDTTLENPLIKHSSVAKWRRCIKP